MFAVSRVWKPSCKSLTAQELYCKGVPKLETIAVLLLLLWLLGVITSYTVGGFIHLLLVIAIVAVLIRVIQGRRAI